MLNPLEKVIAFCGEHIKELKYSSGEAVQQISEKFANFVFNSSKRTDVVILIFNAIAILSSHTAQINGLENSTRENKDFLIELEEKERKIDLGLTLIPPLIVNSIISRKLEKGEITTKYTQKLLTGPLIEDVGLSNHDIYSTVTHKENFLRTSSDIIEYIKKKGEDYPDTKADIEEIILAIKNFLYKEFPQVYKNFDRKLKEYNKYLERTAVGFHNSVWKVVRKWEEMERDCAFSGTNETRELLRNGSAIDEIYGMKNGILVASSVAYSILASNAIMPFLKNRWTNQEYDRDLKEKGETRKSMRRKRRFEYTENPVTEKADKIFDVFSNSNNKLSNDNLNKLLNNPPVPVTKKENNTFKNFDLYTDLSYKNTGLKI